MSSWIKLILCHNTTKVLEFCPQKCSESTIPSNTFYYYNMKQSDSLTRSVKNVYYGTKWLGTLWFKIWELGPTELKMAEF